MVVNLSILSSTSNNIRIRANLIPDTDYADFALGDSSSKFVAGYFEEGHFDHLKIENIPLSNFLHYESGTVTATTTWSSTGRGTSDSPYTWLHEETEYKFSGLASPSIDIANGVAYYSTSSYNGLVAGFLLLSATNIQVYRSGNGRYLNFTSSVRADEPSSSPERYGQRVSTVRTFDWNYIAIY